MISVHERVDAILKHVDPGWIVVDFGAGDCYLSQKHIKTINVDRIDATGIDYVVDLDWERPNINGDIAVMSGLLEWCVYALEILTWALDKYPRVYFSYAGKLADNRWAYTCTLEEIEAFLIKRGSNYSTEQWNGQTLFFVTRDG